MKVNEVSRAGIVKKGVHSKAGIPPPDGCVSTLKHPGTETASAGIASPRFCGRERLKESGQTLHPYGGEAGGGARKVCARSQLSRFLKSWRQTNKLPLKAVAEDVGVSIETISAWEHGYRFPSAENLDNLATFIGIPVCRFFCRYRTLGDDVFDRHYRSHT